MCIGMANGRKSITEELRKNSAIKNTNGIIECDLDLVHKTIQKFTVEVVEEQENIIMRTIQYIGGDEYSHITIDKNKVVDAFKKQIPKKPIEDISKDYEGNIIDDVFFCPECTRTICFGCESDIEKNYPYCNCGQALDWSDIK